MSSEERRSPRFHLPDGSRSVRSVWVWRGLFFMAIIAIGICISLLSSHKTLYAAAWGAIGLGWFGISMWLWRQHVKDQDAP